MDRGLGFYNLFYIFYNDIFSLLNKNESIIKYKSLIFYNQEVFK